MSYSNQQIEDQMCRVMAAFEAACDRAESKKSPKSASKYLRANPSATWSKIVKATGCGIAIAKQAIRIRDTGF